MFNRLLREAKNNSDIIGFILFGSRGAGEDFIHLESDYDLLMIVKDNVKIKYCKKYYETDKIEVPGIDLIIKTVSELKLPLEEWERDTFARVKILVSKNKWLNTHINEISKIPKSEVKKYIAGNLDGYINYVYRSLKCKRDKNEIGARLEANRSIELFLKIAFGLHKRRSVPYYKYLNKELIENPLTEMDLSSQQLTFLIRKIIDSADIKSQQKLLIETEKTFRKNGFGNTFDDWGNKLDWMKKFI